MMGIASAMRSVRIRAENARLEKWIKETVDTLASEPEKSVRVTTKVARFILIRHPVILTFGRSYSTQVRNVGSGVKEMYLKEIGGKNGG